MELATVIEEKKYDNYLGRTDMHVQSFIVKYKNGKTYYGEHIIYRESEEDRKKYGVSKPVEVGQKVMTYKPDRRQKIYNASIVNNTIYS